MIMNEQQPTQSTKQTNLNPHALEFHPNTNILTHSPPKLIYRLLPQQQPLFFYPRFNFFYRPHYFSAKTMLGSEKSDTSFKLVSKVDEPVVSESGLGPGRVRKVNKSSSNNNNNNMGRVWVRKDVMNHPSVRACNYPYGDITSLMIRNIPVRFSRKELMDLIEGHCRMENEKIAANNDDEPTSEFDFLYLPIDFKRKGNLGYAFVNFTSWQGALRLFRAWNGTKWEDCPYRTQKIRRICRAKYQGQELRAHFEKSVFSCESDEYLPVVISPPRNGINAQNTELITIGTHKHFIGHRSSKPSSI